MKTTALCRECAKPLKDYPRPGPNGVTVIRVCKSPVCKRYLQAQG